MRKEPNILWIIVDHMAFAGHYRQAKPDYCWPRLEQLAEEGAWFERCYTTVPVCTPARASLMTGMRPGHHGMRWNPEYAITQNLKEFRPGQKLFSDFLREAGYDTEFVGKWHCGRDRMPTDYGMKGWSLADYGNVYHSEAYKRYLHERGLTQPVCRIDHNLFDPRLDNTEVLLDPPEPWTYMDGSGVLLGPSEAQEQFFVANTAADSIAAMQNSDKPWCLVSSFWGPHHPYIPSEEYAARIDPASIQPYPSFAEDMDNKPMRYGVHRDLRCDFRAHQRWPDWKTWQTVMARCYAQGLQTDAAIGILLDALAKTDQADNTLVIVTAYHGDAIASHGAGWDKYSSYSEEVGRVPLVMRWPGQLPSSQRRRELCSGLDITATLLDAAGVDTTSLDGASLLPLFKENTHDWREALVVEHYGHSGDVCFQRIVYFQDYKYVAAWGDDDELYDLKNDSYELHNLVARPEYSQTLRHLQHLALEDLVQEREARANAHPPSEMEHKLVASTARWPREEKLLCYKLERALGHHKKSDPQATAVPQLVVGNRKA